MSIILGALGAAAGTAGGILSNNERIRQAKEQRKLLRIQQRANKRNLRGAADILEGNMTLGALSATNQSEEAAVEAFQNKSQMEASAGASGISSGTPFFALDKYIVDSASKLREMNSALRTQLGIQERQGELQIAGLRDQIEVTGIQLKNADRAVRYASSPFAAIVSGLTGALSGAAAGNRIEAMRVGMFGVEQADPALEVSDQMSEFALGETGFNIQQAPFTLSDSGSSFEDQGDLFFTPKNDFGFWSSGMSLSKKKKSLDFPILH